MTQYTFDEQIVSDLHKDARGWRPREYFWNEWDAASDDEKQVIWDRLLDELDWEMERQKRAHERAIADFEENISINMSVGALTREVAIRWIVESLNPDEIDLRYGGSWVCYELGLPYSMEKEFESICKELASKMEREE